MERKGSVGGDKNKGTATHRWEALGREDLAKAGFYGEFGSGSHENRNEFFPNPINGAVVSLDPCAQNNLDSDTMVILANASVHKPLTVCNGYDACSDIENLTFRAPKQD